MPTQSSQSSSEQPPKAKYRITNWADYNKALIQRGSLTIWFNVEALDQWKSPTQPGKPGHPFEYGDIAIECALTLKAVYHLPFRQTQGFLASLLELVHLNWDVPNYTTLCRRQKTVAVPLGAQSATQPRHVVIDATGLKVYGEGEWQVKTHGKTRRRVWRKIHLGIDEATGDVVACEVTESGTHEKEELPGLLDQVTDPIAQVSTDGAYDFKTCYDAIAEREARAVIPPRSNAIIWDNGAMDARDANIRRIQEIGRKAWKQESGYYRRSLAETGIFRLKRIFGPLLSTRVLAHQQCEVRLRCVVLNRMTALGMPISQKISG
jgi:hypothetical protein